jgi:hypothetical protein
MACRLEYREYAVLFAWYVFLCFYCKKGRFTAVENFASFPTIVSSSEIRVARCQCLQVCVKYWETKAFNI